MTPLSIFLIIGILACVCFGIQPSRESFTSKCKTLRCEKDQYYYKKNNNTTTKHLTTLTYGYIDTMKNYLSKLKQRLL